MRRRSDERDKEASASVVSVAAEIVAKKYRNRRRSCIFVYVVFMTI